MNLSFSLNLIGCFCVYGTRVSIGFVLLYSLTLWPGISEHLDKLKIIVSNQFFHGSSI